MKQMILEISEGAEFDVMPEPLQKAIEKARIKWPESRLIGTSAIDGKQLILILSGVDKSTLTDLMNNNEFDENGEQIKFNLGWTVLACEGEQIDQSLILPYFDDSPTFDENGDQIGFEPVVDLTNKLQIWAGHKWTF